MRSTLLVICCCFAGSLAWLPPERCQQSKSKRSTNEPILAHATTLSISEITRIQQSQLESDYKNYSFSGVPIRATCKQNGFDTYSAFNCKFYTYNPQSIGNVDCTDSNCKLSRSVSTVDTYTADEGYNWGVSISTKATIAAVYEVGASVSAGGSYRCSYTKGRTVTDTVECSATGTNGNLNLYSVRSDMKCEFGTVKMEKEKRDYAFGAISDTKTFTKEEIQEIRDSAAIVLNCNIKNTIILDTSTISTRLYQKVLNVFPKFSPYTDTLTVSNEFIVANYYKVKESINEYQKVIPFTTPGGDAVYQYACVYKARQ